MSESELASGFYSTSTSTRLYPYFCMMSHPLRLFFSLIGLIITTGPDASAQAPDSVAGRAAEMKITYGNGPFAPSGSSRLLMSATDNTYGLVSLSGGVASSFGTFSYTKTGYSTAVAKVVDSVVKEEQTVSLTFSTESSGTFYTTISGAPYHQQGTFRLYAGPSPSTVKGMTFDVQVDEGSDPFSSDGSFKLKTDPVANTYQIYGGYGVSPSTGTYVYTPRDSGMSTIVLRDSQTGASMSQTLSWDTASSGAYVVRDANQKGYQAGTFKVIALNQLPTITQQPLSVTLNKGAATMLKVVVSSAEATTYQWKKAGVAIPGATSPLLLIGPASVSDAGSYSVSITNPTGTVSSSTATVSVNGTTSSGQSPDSISGRAVEVTIQEASYDFAVGERYRLLISSSGDTFGTVYLSEITGGSFGKMAYRKTGASSAVFESIPEAFPSLPISAKASLYFSSETEGYYALTEPYAPAEYEIGKFRLYNGKAPSSISGTTFEVQVQAGRPPYASTGTFKIKTSPLNDTYQIFDGVGTQSSAGTYQYTAGDQGSSSITLTDSSGGTVRSHTLSWETSSAGAYIVGGPTNGTYQAGTFKVSAVIPRPVITTQPVGTTVSAGGSVSLKVVATSADPLSYQWRKGGIPINGATASSLTLPAATEFSAGVYDVVVSSASGIVTSAGAEVRVVFPPKILTPPEAAAAELGENVSLSVSVAGTPPFTFKWRKSGVLIPSATTEMLTLSGVKAGDFGSYTVEITNGAGSTTSAPVELSLGEKVVITTQPTSVSTRADSAATFTVTAAGTEPLSYQWKKDGNVIPGATRASLTIPRATVSETGSYEVFVYNAFGNATSIPAQLSLSGEKGISLLDNPLTGPLTVVRGSTGSVSVSVDAADPSLALTTYRLLRLPVAGPAVQLGLSNVVPANGTISLPLRSIGESGTYAIEYVRQYADGSSEVRVVSEPFTVETIPMETAAGVYELLLEDSNLVIPDGATYRGMLIVTITKSGAVSGRLSYNEAAELSGSDDSSLRVYQPVTRSFSGIFSASTTSTQKLVCSPKLGMGNQSGRQKLFLELDFTTSPISLSASVDDSVSAAAAPDSEGALCTAIPVARNLTKLEGTLDGASVGLAEAVGRYNLGSLLDNADEFSPGMNKRALIFAQVLSSARVLWVSRVTGQSGSGSSGLHLEEAGALIASLYEGRLVSTPKLHQSNSLLGALQLDPLESGGWKLHTRVGYGTGTLERQTSYLSKTNGQPEYSEWLDPAYQGTKSANWTGTSRLDLSADGSGAWVGATKAGLFRHFSLNPAAVEQSSPRICRLSVADPSGQTSYSWLVSLSSTGGVRSMPESFGQPALLLRFDKLRGEFSGSYVPNAPDDRLRRTIVGAALFEPSEQNVRAHGWVELNAIPATRTSAWRLEPVSP